MLQLPQRPETLTAARRGAACWAATLAIVALALALRAWIWPDEFGHPYLVYYVATAWIFYGCGLTQGCLAVALFAVAAYRVGPPLAGHWTLQTDRLAQTAAYVAFGLAFGIVLDRWRRTVAALRASEARLLDLYDNAPCGQHSIDAEGRFVNANALMLSWLGCGRDEVIGRLGPTDFCTPEGRAQFEAQFPALKSTGRLGPLELDLVSRDGTVRRVIVLASAVRDAAGRFVKSRSVLYDISDMHRLRSRMQQLNQEQEAMLDNDLVGIAKLREGIIVWKNKALARIFGYPHQQLLGQPALRLYPDEQAWQDFEAAAREPLAAGRHYRTQLPMRHHSGDLIWIDLSGVRLDGDAHEVLWMMADITPMKRYQEQVEHIAFHDALTGLPNRLLLSDRLLQALLQAGRVGRKVALCYLDLDGFKAVNDFHGHEAGDALLREVAQRLQRCVRGNDTVARIGGDEFVMLLPQIESRGECLAIVERVQGALAQPVALADGARVTVSASIGISFHPTHGSDPGTLLNLADAAMFEAKHAGTGLVRIHGLSAQSQAAD
ncbi:MAG: sensor domain-containing diguanylate cyclase [Burkholderiales bacterium]|nr:sensor domain-containing diguanylate cyclase [Burkholderiales bacterium]MDE1926504.1 sensor domain-containing diguanylate cyclase [Burkholderiales bacterium]MDE2160418.1 sensor domain-containing diguanylate cyclase [Burkholderiales bacterium]MDE2502635.1 sensor domain-containing diguanylate cyclase [Burkholderiales bacterium]